MWISPLLVLPHGSSTEELSACQEKAREISGEEVKLREGVRGLDAKREEKVLADLKDFLKEIGCDDVADVILWTPQQARETLEVARRGQQSAKATTSLSGMAQVTAEVRKQALNRLRAHVSRADLLAVQENELADLDMEEEYKSTWPCAVVRFHHEATARYATEISTSLSDVTNKWAGLIYGEENPNGFLHPNAKIHMLSASFRPLSIRRTFERGVVKPSLPTHQSSKSRWADINNRWGDFLQLKEEGKPLDA